MTEREARVLGCIRRYISEHGISPSLHEVSEMTDIPYSTVRHAINSLSESGHLHKPHGRVRGISLVQEPAYKHELVEDFLDTLIHIGEVARRLKQQSYRKEISDGLEEA